MKTLIDTGTKTGGADSKPEISPIAMLFLPFSVVLFFMLFKYLNRPAEKITYFLIAMSAVGPTILMGNAYYPRFEFMNVIVMIVCFGILGSPVHKSRQYFVH